MKKEKKKKLFKNIPIENFKQWNWIEIKSAEKIFRRSLSERFFLEWQDVIRISHFMKEIINHGEAKKNKKENNLMEFSKDSSQEAF